MNIKRLIKSLAIPIIVGIVSGLIMMPFNDYSSLNQPPLSPPAILFPIMWSILYILMGISAYIIKDNLDIYYFQLFFNGFWPIIFFVFKLYLIAFIWLVILIVLVIIMIKRFYQRDKTAGLLQIPYLLWILFASYLNFGVFILN